ncbi:MAG: ABC transporter permease [Ignavibacteriaceae bacterium]|nr:ABC transporter permease [Ignavibacteriaceae bacterium]
MRIEKFIALRYLFSRHRVNFITIISYLSIAGIAIGTGALIVVLSVFNGFSSLVQSYLIGLDPHVRITLTGDESKINPDSLFAEMSPVSGFTPIASGKAIVTRNKVVRIVNVNGVDHEAAKGVYGLEEFILYGNYDLKDNVYPKAMIGFLMAERLQLLPGDTIQLVSPSDIKKFMSALVFPPSRTFVISGIFLSNNNDYDANYIFTSLSSARSLFGVREEYPGIDIKLNDINLADQFKSEMEDKLGENYQVETWYDLHSDLYNVMQLERWVAYIILSLIIVVATFNILASLSMTVIEKSSDLGTLKALGLNDNSVYRIFIYQGLFVGVIGTFLGFVLSLAVYWLQVNYKFYPLDPLKYKIDALPMLLSFYDFITVGLASLILATLASVIPARNSLKIKILEAIRYE